MALFLDKVRAVVHRMHRVHAQAVEMELLDPVQRVVEEEVAHRAAVLGVEVDRRVLAPADHGKPIFPSQDSS